MCIRLSPDHLDRLDRLAAARRTNRSALIARLIERVADPEANPPPAHPSMTLSHGDATGAPTNVVQLPVSACVHRETMIVGGGIKRCRQCGATQGMDRVWR